MKIGRTGNEVFPISRVSNSPKVLNLTRARMGQENIQGNIYCHPIGDYGHSAGPLIGLWDHQVHKFFYTEDSKEIGRSPSAWGYSNY